MKRICGVPFLFLAAQFENIVHFYFFRDIDVGMHYLPEFGTHYNANNLIESMQYHLLFLPHNLKMSCIFTSSEP